MTNAKISLKVYFVLVFFFTQNFKSVSHFKEVVIGPIHINEVIEHQVHHKGCVPVDFLL